MGLAGSFKEFSPADIIQVIQLQKKSGRLTVSSDGQDWTLGFQDGAVVFASTGQHGMPLLGEILVRQGYLDRDTLVEALRRQEKQPGHLGMVLEQMGMLTHADIARALTFQIQETALNLFFHVEGDYRFERVPVRYDRNYVTPINTEFLLMEGARRVDEWPAILNVIGGGDSVFCPVGSPDEDAVAALSKPERQVFDALDGVRDVDQLVQHLGMGLFDAGQRLARLVRQGLARCRVSGDHVPVDPICDTPMGPTLRSALADGGAANGIALPIWWVAGLVTLSAAAWAAMGMPR